MLMSKLQPERFYSAQLHLTRKIHFHLQSSYTVYPASRFLSASFGSSENLQAVGPNRVGRASDLLHLPHLPSLSLGMPLGWPLIFIVCL